MEIRISTKWLERLDTFGHKLRLPRRILGPLCDAYDKRLTEGSPWIQDDGQWTSSTGGNVTVTYSTLSRHRA